MGIISWQLAFVAAIILLGALVETYRPELVPEEMKVVLTILVKVVIGLLLCFLFLMFFIKLRNREGFEDVGFMTRWKKMMDENKVDEVCRIYKDIYEKMVTVEKGPPQDQKTDAQAREAVDRQFAKLMTVTPVACHDIEELNNANHLDTFYEKITKVPQNMLIQVYETATACRALLLQSYNKIKKSEEIQKEAFQDKPLCEDAAAAERKAYLERKPLSKEAEQCLLVSEIPAETKEKVIQTRLDQIQKSFDTYNVNKEPISKVLEECKRYADFLEKKKKEAEDLSAKYSW